MTWHLLVVVLLIGLLLDTLIVLGLFVFDMLKAAPAEPPAPWL